MPSDLSDKTILQEKQDKNAIAILLEKHLNQDNQLLVQSNPMGATSGYIGSVSLQWLNSRVRFASQLPLFRQKFDQHSKNVIRDAETIEEIQQRPLDWSRQAPLTQYLVARKNHKFTALLVVVSPPWVDDPYAKEWDLDGCANQNAIEFSPLDQTGKLGLLNVSPEVAIFALDGQHRLMAVQGLMELIRTGQLPCYNKQRKITGTTLNLDEISQEYGISSTDLEQLADEQIGIEFIPAIVPGETTEAARQRVRSIFVHVNLMAVRLSRGQLALLDEDNPFAIIARKTAVYHPLLAEREYRHPRVNWDSATVASKSAVLTTLQALQDMAERYLSPKFRHWQSAQKNALPLRPNEEELETGLAEFKTLWDYLTTLPSYQKLEAGVDTPKLRRFSHEKGGGEANLLFRPVGQIALIQALGILVYQQQMSLKTLIEKLHRFDADGGFSRMEYSDSLWYGILYDPIKKRIQVSGRDLASRLLIYLLGGMKDNLQQAKLRQDFVKARTIEAKTISYEGKFVSPRELSLPPRL